MTTTTEKPEASAQATLDHHLGAFAKGLDELLLDYNEESVLVALDKTFRGTGEIRGFFKAFIEGADPKFWEAFRIQKIEVHGAIAYLAWEATPWVPLATDTLYVKDGKIAVQTFTAFVA